MYPFVDYSKESQKDRDNFSYAVCQCFDCPRFGYKVPKSESKDFEYFTCPNCQTKISIYIRKEKPLKENII